MALPVVEKTWSFNVNRMISGVGSNPATCYPNLLYKVKETLKTIIGWTVVGSGNGATAAAMDGVDRWTSYGEVRVCNGAGNNRSWIVLKNAALAANFQVCLDYATNGADWWESNLTVAVSESAGFTGGALNARPTATDEHVINNGLSGEKWFGNHGGYFDMVLHAMWTADGFTRLVFTGPRSYAYWFFERQKAPPAGITSDLIYGIKSDRWDNSYLRYADWNDVARARGRHNSINYTAYLSSEFYAGQAVGERLTGNMSFGQGYSLTPVGLISETVGTRGRLGRMYDLWWGPTGAGEGTCYATQAGNRKLVQFGHLVMPWNSSLVRLS